MPLTRPLTRKLCAAKRNFFDGAFLYTFTMSLSVALAVAALGGASGSPVVYGPKGIAASYTPLDLVQGWALYAVALAAVIACPSEWRLVMSTVFGVSILWHMVLMRRSGPTRHHALACVANAVGLALCV